MLKKLLYILSAVILAICLYFIYTHINQLNKIDSKAINKGKIVTSSLISHLESTLEKLEQEANSFKEQLLENNLTKKQLEDLIKEKTVNLDNVLGITVAYEKDYFIPGLYAPYYDKSKNKFIYIEDVYDYTDASLETAQWHVKVRDNGSRWVEPYYAQGAGTMVADYGTPLKSNGEVVGTITITISLEQFSDYVHKLSLGKTGYGIIISEKGKVLSHPVKSYVGQNFYKINREFDKTHQLLKSKFKSNTEGKSILNDESSEKEIIAFYKDVTISKWKVALIYYKDELIDKNFSYKSSLLIISGSLSLFLIALFLAVLKLKQFNKRRAWKISIFLTVLFLINIFLLWNIEYYDSNNYDDSNSPPITDISSLNRFIQIQNDHFIKKGLGESYQVPTGLYIERFDFEDTYNVGISGTIWQKYPKDLFDKITPGIMFIQTSPFAEASYLKEAYTDTLQNQILKGYDFRLSLRVNFDYDRFPLDKRNVNIKIKPLDKDNNIILVPDLSSYKQINPLSKPGLNDDIELPGNELMNSYFNYKITDFDTDFGFDSRSKFEQVPVLQYNINIRRVLINAFVSYLIPIIVVLLMMFILINTGVKITDTTPKLGIMESLAAFFFVLIFSHIALRNTIETPQLMYLEYFYFVSYFMLIASVFNLISFTRKDDVLFFDYKNNLIAKISFWPLYLFIIYIITVITFYI